MTKPRQILTALLSVGAVTSLVLLSAAPAKARDRRDHDHDHHAAIAISTCGYVITAPGRYALAANLNCSGFPPPPPPPPGSSTPPPPPPPPTGPAITVQASHVRLELNDHSITGSGSDDGILVYSAAGRLSDIEIEGPGVVTHFANGIDLENLSDSSVEGVTSTFNSGNGLVTNYSSASTATRLRLTGNVVSSNGAWGMILGSINDSQIRHNVTALNATAGAGGVAGLAILGGSHNLVQDNVSTGNYGSGILIANGSSVAATSNQVRDNVASGNTVAGISITSGTGNLIEGNEALGNSGYPGSYDVTDATPCGTNTWRDNAFVTSNEACIVPAVHH
ncbi:MAG TPA: right-handed parallel beta-helix repeat-containing protein [Vicinamibacterales bacterium]|nr:right-handed parallel beta-helix repeat-containing protein [Vicinamibacterales bacterium]